MPDMPMQHASFSTAPLESDQSRPGAYPVLLGALRENRGRHQDPKASPSTACYQEKKSASGHAFKAG